VTDEVVEAFARLMPQLSTSSKAPGKAAIAAMVAAEANTILLARSEDGTIVGTLTLVMFRIPTGLRTRIEDVVVDQAAGRKGFGTALTAEAISIARAAGAKTVDLSTRPSREAAGRLYEKMGFEIRSTRVYRYHVTGGAG
jgi:ribosomal protein S18 acetylase RimI-like enzyme